MAELQQKEFQKRQVAYKLRISDILQADFEKADTFSGYVRVGSYIVSRVNLIAIVVVKPESAQNYSSIVIDDGTGKILLRNFENQNAFLKADVGDFVNVIGKIRDFNGERYILPEIIKKISNIEWINVRKIELINIPDKISGPKQEDKANIEESGTLNLHEEIYSFIKGLDSGNGAFIDEVIKKSNNDKAEIIVKKLLENGDVFEISPGRLKVLE